MNLETLLAYGNMLVKEQENVKRVQLADTYLASAALGDANKDQMEQGTFFEDGYAQQVGVPVPAGCPDPTTFYSHCNLNPFFTLFNPSASLPSGGYAQQVGVPVPAGCSDPNAVNYDPTVRSDDGSCVYDFAQ
ncbi:unnamed protein product [Closterium sp. Naga37s-1]|nr:unnamed protein product [Closterium sp. Naga37s-1]